MLRSLYAAIIGLHPRHFRERFGPEMIDIFDQAGRPLPLWGDALGSLIRQRWFRPANRPAAAVAAGAPIFALLADGPPVRGTVLRGSAFALLLFIGLNFALALGRGRLPDFVIGAKYPRPSFFGITRTSLAAVEPTTEIKIPSPKVDPLFLVTHAYFRVVRVLDKMDADGDRILSPREIASAPARLADLDRNRDGILDAEECGFPVYGRRDPAEIARARVLFMRNQPVLAALDQDHDGAISFAEINGAPTALAYLDRNRDRSLEPAEILPDIPPPAALRVIAILDTDRDGTITRTERATPAAQPLRELLDAADRDGNSSISFAELAAEVRLREQRQSLLDRALKGTAPLHRR